jgi:hypothetical protein
MIAPLRTNCLADETESVNQRFLALLPQIQRQAQIALRGLRPEARDELTQEVTANAFCAFVQLVRRGRATLAYPTPLTDYAIRQIRSGRRVGCRLNVNDVLSGYAQRRKAFRVERLDNVDLAVGQWRAALVEDHHTPVDQQVAFRLDFPAWLSQLAPRQRRIAEFLAVGNSTSDAACRFRLSPARISQLRSWFRNHWEQFQGGGQLEGRAA